MIAIHFTSPPLQSDVLCLPNEWYGLDSYAILLAAESFHSLLSSLWSSITKNLYSSSSSLKTMAGYKNGGLPLSPTPTFHSPGLHQTSTLIPCSGTDITKIPRVAETNDCFRENASMVHTLQGYEVLRTLQRPALCSRRPARKRATTSSPRWWQGVRAAEADC